MAALHDALSRRVSAIDQVVYLGNYVGVGAKVRETLDELVGFRRWLLARPRSFAADVVHLRGAQEEMWSKLLQLQFAPNPVEVLRWMLDHGLASTLTGYGGDAAEGFQSAREGPMALTRWTNGLRAAVAAQPGHTAFASSLRRAALTPDHALLFVHAGIDPARPLAAQTDSFWWAGASFEHMTQPYADFRYVVRGFDPDHRGVARTDITVSIDGGCGFGGSLIALCFRPDGEILDQIEV